MLIHSTGLRGSFVILLPIFVRIVEFPHYEMEMKGYGEALLFEKKIDLFYSIVRAHRPNDRCVFRFAQVCLSRREELFQEVSMSEQAIGEQQIPVLDQQTVTVLMRHVLGCQERELLKWQGHNVAGWNR